MKHPEKAIILCAGFGTRMLPLTENTPKPLFPFWGSPTLLTTLRTIKQWGVKKVLINIHHRPDAIVNYIRRSEFDKLAISFSFEPEILGTGGAIHKAQWFLDDKPFWILNSDIVADLSPTPIIKTFIQTQSVATLWLTTQAGPRTVEIDKANNISTFRSKTPGAENTLTFTGVQLVSPAVTKYITKGFSSIIDAYKKSISAGERITGIPIPNTFWADIGNHDAYIKAHLETMQARKKNLPGKSLMPVKQLKHIKELKLKGVKIDGFVCTGKNVIISGKSKLKNTVIWDNSKILAGANIKNAIIAENTSTSGETSRIVIPASDYNDPQITRVIKQMDWQRKNTIVSPLAPRGSDRIFTRLIHKRKSVIVIQYGKERPENTLYTKHTKLLKKLNVPVPSVILDIPKERLSVIEDAGEDSIQSLYHELSKRNRQLINTYKKVIDSAWQMHNQGTLIVKQRKITLAEPFTMALYKWEHKLFTEHYIKQYATPTAMQLQAINKELQAVAKLLISEPATLIHRDLQSSNVLIKHNKPILIDFQGMRLGAAVYDIASLLCDPYVEITPKNQTLLLKYYASISGRTHEDLCASFRTASIQRLIQALGAFGRLSACRGMIHFKSYIMPGLNMLDYTLKHVNYFPYLTDFVHTQILKG